MQGTRKDRRLKFDHTILITQFESHNLDQTIWITQFGSHNSGRTIWITQFSDALLSHKFLNHYFLKFF